MQEQEERSIQLPISTFELPEKMIEKIQKTDEEFKRVSETLNNQLTLLLEGYLMSLEIPENSKWKLSDDKKCIEIFE